MKKLWMLVLGLCVLQATAQNPEEDKIKTSYFPEIGKIENSKIPGAVTLGQPQWIKGKKQEIRTEKHGLIYPAFYDWNKDGKQDMLLGEFETGDTGSNIKVYLNEGSNKKPKYSGEYFYAMDVNGDTITNHQWCCIGIHPRIVDMDGDGYLDILSGQYNPGLISWWRGSEKGFLPRKFIDQEGYVENARLTVGNQNPPWDPKSNNYWNYTSADFADFNGDGLLDLYVGGSGGMRISLNEGTKANPRFGKRAFLYHVDGKVLSHKRPSDKKLQDNYKNNRYTLYSGGMKSYMKPIDWDKDGVQDLLVTHEYISPGQDPILFFRGVNTDKGLRYEEAVPLVTAADGSKLFPGCQPMITVTDYNADGVEDIVFGVSIPTINGFEVDKEVAFGWVEDFKMEMPGKDAGRNAEYYGGMEGYIEHVKKADHRTREFYMGAFKDYKYLTLRHRGYAFVMYGKAATDKAIAKRAVAGEEEVIPEITNEQIAKSDSKGPVKFQIETVERVYFGKEHEIEVTLKFDEGWYGYSDGKEGFEPTQVNIDFPDYVTKIGEAQLISAKAGNKLSGEVKFKQKFKYDYPRTSSWEDISKEFDFTTKVSFQPCCEDKKLDPQEEEVKLHLVVDVR